MIGNDGTLFHSYWRYYSTIQSAEVVGFVDSSGSDPIIKSFRGCRKAPIKIYPLRKLEKAIAKRRVQRCVIQTQNVKMDVLHSIIYRIHALGGARQN